MEENQPNMVNRTLLRITWPVGSTAFTD